MTLRLQWLLESLKVGSPIKIQECKELKSSRKGHRLVKGEELCDKQGNRKHCSVREDQREDGATDTEEPEKTPRIRKDELETHTPSETPENWISEKGSIRVSQGTEK